MKKEREISGEGDDIQVCTLLSKCIAREKLVSQSRAGDFSFREVLC